MGKGDLKTQKGKRIRSSYGKTRAQSTKLSALDQLKVNIAKRFGAIKAEKTEK